MPIKDWNEDDKPREKLMTQGAEACTVAELLAILITNGVHSKAGYKSAVQLGEEVMNTCDNNLIWLVRNSMASYQTVDGIGPAKACIIKAAAELGRRIHIANLGERVKINSPQAAYTLMQGLKLKATEEFWAIFTNNSGMMLQRVKIGDGNAGNVPVDLRKLTLYALNCNASRVILCHNHPGGSNFPSSEDINLTNDIKALMNKINVSVVEHIIIAGDSYYSFMENKLV
jgi:DNA repair protein RadC